MSTFNSICWVLLFNCILYVQAFEFDCRETPCINDGKCVHTNSTGLNETLEYKCECEVGFVGLQCEFSSQMCDNGNCFNRGICVQNIRSGRFSCFCNAGYFGETCHMTNLCLNNMCQNGGTCYPVADVSYRCICPPGLTGANCEKYIEPKYCNFNVCKNGGNCTIEPSGLIQCICRPGYIGTACEINTALCATQTCNNRGVCLLQLNGDYQCLCDPSFGGKDCEIDSICRENLCQNGGTCRTLSDETFECLCPPDYAGTSCEYRICEIENNIDLSINVTDVRSLNISNIVVKPENLPSKPVLMNILKKLKTGRVM